MTVHVHFAIGPVQGFVAQARRTRDLWGGSYLLSFLSAHAMAGALAAGATIVQPRVDDDPLLGWIQRRPGARPPRYGSLPNQFTAQLDDDGALDRVIAAITRGFHGPWTRICDAVWDAHLAAVAPLGRDTREIWDHQTQGFWELTWVAGPEAHGLLDRRKHWRTHRLPEERGDKCTVMSELQELSGFERAHQRDEQEAFWAALRGRLGELELRDYERLCALAVVKRLYATAARHVLGADIDVEQWPSTIDVAAVPWVERALRVAPREARAYASAVVEAADRSVLTGGVSSLVPGQAADREVRRLGANWFHRGFAASPRLAVLPPAREAERAALCKRLQALTDARDDQGVPLGSPPIYYALLLADGDSLGKLLLAGGRTLVSRALARFTSEVEDLVRARQGSAIYAGGDDVLAILPIDRALDGAHALEHAFRCAFTTAAADREASMEARAAAEHASLSVAVVFAHARSPLHRVLQTAHHLLDDVAKDQNGRASLVAAIYRGAAVAAQWVTTWQRAPGVAAAPPASPCDHGEACAVAHLAAAVHARSSSSVPLSSSLLHDPVT